MPTPEQQYQWQELVDAVAVCLNPNLGIISIAVAFAIEAKRPPQTILKTLQQIAQDNRATCVELIGEEITTQVLGLNLGNV